MKKTNTLNSLSCLSKAFNIPEKQPKYPKSRKCFRCGGNMRHIEGTNVFVCTGTTKNKDGKEKQCMNRLLVGTKGF